MKYRPGGYSWLTVAPESSFELEIEKLEDQIHFLKKQYEQKEEEKLLQEIHVLQAEIKQRKEQLKNQRP